MAQALDGHPTWTFLTNHAHVLIAVASEPDVRIRDIATKIGITERAAQRILSDLVTEGYVETTRVGRRNHYTVVNKGPFRHPTLQEHQIGDLLEVLLDD
jgi:predicted transcriptional regulator